MTTLPNELRVEACVIGSGAGGAVAAAVLAENGFDTLLLEAGDHHPAASMTQDEHRMIPRLFAESGQRTTSDQSIMVMQGRALGGGTTHNTGLCVPAPEALWRRWSAEHATPCGFEAFRPHCDRVLEAICARQADPDEINANNRLLADGAAARGWSAQVAHHNRIRCSGCGYCTLGCAYNRKVSVVHAFLPAGIRHGLRIATNATARVLDRVGKVWRVRVAAADGDKTIETPIVVLAAGAVETPLLLQRSRLAGRSPVGRGLHLHPFAPVGALFDREIDAHRGVPQSILVDEHAEAFRGGDGGYILMAAAAQPAIAAVMTPGTGAVHRSMMTRFTKLAAAGVLVHDRTEGSVRARRDRKPLIDYWPGPDDMADLRRGIRQLAEIYFDQGARAVALPFASFPIAARKDDLARLDRIAMRRHDLTLGSVHPQGTCAMGREPRRSVVDGEGAVHGQTGLFVADASLFPTSIGVPPQVTTMALARVVALGIAARRAAPGRSGAFSS